MKVTLAVEYEDSDGKTYEPNTTVEVSPREASSLINTGRARVADDPKPQARRTSVAQKEN